MGYGAKPRCQSGSQAIAPRRWCRQTGGMLGLNQDFPLLLSSVLEHGAANFGGVAVVSVNRDEHLRLDYRTVADRAPLVFDTRNATEGIQSDNIVRL